MVCVANEDLLHNILLDTSFLIAKFIILKNFRYEKSQQSVIQIITSQT